MLHLLYGPAASGKTDLLMGRIRAAVAARTPGQVLLVPEQYSHEAERALCAACGDSLSLYAEVLSFTGLARRVAAETGAGDAPLLDQGGRLLCMALALDQVAPRLRLFGAAARRAQMQQTLLGAVDELKTACVTPDALEETAARCPGYLGDKLHDLALVLAAYDAVTAQGHADPTDRLTHLAERIPESTLGHTGQFYLDGFTDYTRQELAVVRALLTAGADVTVCLTLDALTDGNEIFGTARHTARVLLDMADDCGVPTTVETCPARAADTPLRVLEQQLFSYTSAHFDDPAQTITVHTADDLTAECAWAASRALQLVQSGCRWRDIAIAARGFSDYAPALERMCAYYGVPLYFARRTDLLQKPLVALIRAAYDIVTGGWDAEDVSAYLRTGLAGSRPRRRTRLKTTFCSGRCAAAHGRAPSRGGSIPTATARRTRTRPPPALPRSTTCAAGPQTRCGCSAQRATPPPPPRRRPWRWQIFLSGCTWRSGSTRSPRICAARDAARSRPNMRSSGS